MQKNIVDSYSMLVIIIQAFMDLSSHVPLLGLGDGNSTKFSSAKNIVVLYIMVLLQEKRTEGIQVSVGIILFRVSYILVRSGAHSRNDKN